MRPTSGAVDAGSTGLGSGPSPIAWNLPFLLLIISSLVTARVTATELNSIVKQPEDIGLPPNPTVDRFMGEPADCGGDGFFSPICHEYQAVAPTLLAHALPGLLNLLPFLWLLYRDPAVRMAAFVAGSVGVMRVAVPVILLLGEAERITAPDGRDYFEFMFGDGGSGAVWFFGVAASLVSLATWFAFAREAQAAKND